MLTCCTWKMALVIHRNESRENKCSDAQEEWIADLTRENNMAVVCYGWEAASRVIEDYLGYGREEENG